MAAVQRKLVHKQFNSPIGLYSDQNVKETLDRELRAFSNGTVGIELNDKSAPSNLAKSAVLRMLEEEENEKMHPVNNERKSRSRQRAIIDRDTVLKINRYNSSRLRRRDISWPPVQYLDDSKARSSSEEIHSHKNIPHHKEILHLKKTLNTRTIIENDDNDDESNKTNNNKENMLDTHSMKATITKSLSSIKSNNMKIYSNMKRWRSYENSLDSKNILFNNNNKKISTKTNRKGTNLLPRSNSFNELPPLKPRQKYNKNFHSKTKEKLNLNNSNGKYHENHEMMILNQNENSHTNRNMKNENFLLTLKLNENLKIEPKFHNNKNHNDDIRKFQVNKRTNINSFNTPDSRHNSKLRSFKNRMSLQENNHINNSICNTSAIHNVVTTNNQCVDIENNKNDLILLKKHENRILKTTIIDKNIIRSNNKTNITRTNEINNNNNNNNINENFIGKSENINNHINCPIISNLIKNVTNICYNNNRLENDLMRTNNNIQLNNNEIENNNRTNFLINENIILKNMKNENSFNNSDSYDIDDTNEIIWNQQNGLNNIKIYDEIKKNFENFKITPQIMLMTPQITEQMNTITNKDNNTIEIENNIRSTLNIIVKNIERDENLQEIFPVEKSTCNRKNQNNNTNMKIQQENQKSEQFSYIENKTKVNKNLKKREPNKSYGISSTNKGTSTLNNDMKNCQQETSEDILGQDFSSLFYIFGKTMNIHEEENEDYMKMIENSKKHPIENDAERKFLEISIPENLDAHHPYLLNTSIHTRFSPEQYLNETYALKTSIENVMKFLQNRSSPIIRSLNSIKSFPFIITNIEYIPVVEKALLELSDLSKILHKIDNNQEFLVFETITTSGTIPTTTYITTTKTTLTNITTPKITPIIIENDLQIDELDDNSRDDINSTTISLNTISETESNTSQCSTVVTFDKIYQSKNILSGYLITKQNQENLLKNLHLEQYPEQKHHYHYHKDDDKNVNHHEDDHHHNDQKQESQSSNNSLVIVDLVNGKSLQRTFENDPMNIDKHDSIIHNDDKEESMLKNSLKQNNNIKTHQISSITKFYPKLNLYQNNNDIKSTKNDELILNIEQDNENNIGNINFENSNQIKHEKHKHENDNNNNNNNNDDDHKIIVTNKYDINTDAGDILEERLNFNKSNTNNNPLPVIYLGQQKSVQEHQRHHRQQQQHNNIFRQEHNERQEESSSSSSLQSSSNEQQKCDDNVETTNYMYNISSINKIGGSDKIIYDNHMKKMSNENQAIEIVENLNLQTTSKILHLSRCDRIPPIKSYKIRSISQPPSIKSYTISKNYYDKFKKDQHYIPRQYLFDSCDQNRYYSSPSLYMSGHFERTEGYKRVAWPPADSVTPVKGSTPQPQQQQQQQYQKGNCNFQGGNSYQSEPNQPQYTQQYGGSSVSQQAQLYQQHQQQQQQQYQHQQQHQQYRQQPSAQSYQQEPQQQYNNYPQQQYQTNYSQQQQDYPTAPQQTIQHPPKQSSTVSFSGGIAQNTDSATKSHSYLSHQQYQPPPITPVSNFQTFSPPPTIGQGTQAPQYSSTSSIQSTQYQSPQQKQQYQTQSTQYQTETHYQQSHATGGGTSGSYPTSPSAHSANSPRGWAHVSTPIKSHIGYTQSTNQYQQPSGYSASFESEAQLGSQNQYQQPQANQTYQPPSGQQQSYQQQPQYQPQQQQQQQYQRGPTPQQQQQNQQLSSQANQPQYSSNRGQSPGIITLRKEAPITQAPAPVFTSQPAARNFKGGSKMRGDLKWPPPDCRALMAAEEEHRRMIEMGPAYRPTKVHKDYSGFFAQHALNSTYPGYKIPPGTQHMYVEY